MKSTSASPSRLAVMLVILAMTPVSTVLMNGQEEQTKQAKGVASDWTQQHLVFSNPGTADDAIRNGTYERWLKISTDPATLCSSRSEAQTPQAPPSNMAHRRTYRRTYPRMYPRTYPPSRLTLASRRAKKATGPLR